MDFAKLRGKIFFNNKFINSKDAKIHVLNHSLHFASSVFDGIGVYKGKPLFLKEHLLRLKNSAKVMRLDLDYSVNQLIDICKKLLTKNKINNGYIRPLIFRSSHSMSPETRICKSQIAIAAWKWGKLFNKVFDYTGNHVGWKPLVQFDYSEDQDTSHCIYQNDFDEDNNCIDSLLDTTYTRGVDVSGYDPEALWNNLGDNSGLFRAYYDNNVVAS